MSDGDVVPVVQRGHEALRVRAREVADVETVQDLGRRLAFTMVAEKGIGLAANQIAVDLRVVALQQISLKVLVNPRITRRSEELRLIPEGCLSIREMRGTPIWVRRNAWVEAEYTTLTGAECHVRLEGFPAAALQHELDHLDGVLCSDRALQPSDEEAAAAMEQAFDDRDKYYGNFAGEEQAPAAE